ncbi:MAG TPA: LacI family DNA-binding transcriptional regulator [Spirochaetia bacterium]
MSVVRLQDVAKKAEVSVATASLALSGKGRISEEVRTRVRSAAEDLGYRGGRTQRLRVGSTTLGILHPEDRTYEWKFVRPTLLELEHSLHDRGCAPVLLPFNTRADPELAVRLALASGVAGVFSIQVADPRILLPLEEHGLGVVVINSRDLEDRYPTVGVDDFRGAYEGTRYLLGLGHRSIAFVEYERPDSPSVVADRFIGFRKALDERHVGFCADQRITVPFMDAKRLEKKLTVLFGRENRPTAIFAHDDYLGLYVMEALKKLSLSVPGDVSLLAPGDVLDYELPMMPRITTMRIDTALLGRLAAAMMVDRMKKSGSVAHGIRVKEQLMKRDTCRSIEEE